MSNLYFFNLLREMQMDFSTAFYLVLVTDFADMFLVKAAIA